MVFLRQKNISLENISTISDCHILQRKMLIESSLCLYPNYGNHPYLHRWYQSIWSSVNTSQHWSIWGRGGHCNGNLTGWFPFFWQFLMCRFKNTIFFFFFFFFFIFFYEDDSPILIETLLKDFSLIYLGLTENMELCHGFAYKSFQWAPLVNEELIINCTDV